MPTPRQTEPSANNALGIVLQNMMPSFSVRSENVRTIAGRPNLQPDILITGPGRSPVVLEAEFIPARGVEREARSRLGLEVNEGNRIIEASIALRYPRGARDADDLVTFIHQAQPAWCLFTKAGDDVIRFPESGWLEGSVSDLADLVRLVSVPQRAVDESALALQKAIDGAVAILNEMHQLRPNIIPYIANGLGLTDVPQTRRMVCAIIANAIGFQGRLHGIHTGVKTLRETIGDNVANPQQETLTAWKEILDINYWPIFAVAHDIVEQLPADAASRILRRLMLTAESINASGAHIVHDLTGRVFQRLISDRKYLATFYTLPESASLLARLAVAKLNGIDWSDTQAIGNLRIGDFACGTGALLSAVYEQIAARHERAGGDPASIHPVMMEEVLYGCDVMPSAIHITGSTLSSAQPNVSYANSCLYTLAYGRQSDGSVAIGSLELLQSSAAMALFNTSDPALRTGSFGQETAARVIADVPDGGFDLVIMNPPFTRATNHEGAHADITNPAFAAFNATPEDQTAMGQRTNRLGRDTCYHGNAGIASAFAALAHRKVKPGGVLALVLPLSAAAGLSWQSFRQLLATEYTDLTVLSIARYDRDDPGVARDLAFSSDTGMAECLVVARKRLKPADEAQRGTFVSLFRRPPGLAQASAVAQPIINTPRARPIENGPDGGTRLPIGTAAAGAMLGAPLSLDGDPWGPVRVFDLSLAQIAWHFRFSKLWLPTIGRNPPDLPMAPLNQIGQLGLVHRDINGPAPRGPFDKIDPIAEPLYPALWNHDARRETRILCQPDSELQVREGMKDKADAIWGTATRAHLNSDFTFGSQPLAVAFTDNPTLGGRVWPNVAFPDQRWDYPFALWGNSTLGLFAYWWHSSRQQLSKASMTIRSAESLLVLDCRALSDAQLATAEAIFNEFRDLELQPAYLADADPNRALLDRRVICDLLGFDESIYTLVRRHASRWCYEPSVHGGKARPKSAQFVR